MELNIIEGPSEKEIKTSEKLFQQFAADFIKDSKQLKTYENLEPVVEKDCMFFLTSEGQKVSYIQHEKELSDELQQQLNDSVFVIRSFNDENKTVYQVFQGTGIVVRGVSFTHEGNGVILYQPGMLTREMQFVTFGLTSNQMYVSIVEEFRKAIIHLPSFRLHAVTGNLRFEKM